MMLPAVLALVSAVGAKATNKDSSNSFDRREATLPITRVAAVSCTDQHDPQPGWASLLRYMPDALLFAGDNVYGDVDNDFYGEPVPELKQLAAAYTNQSRTAGFVEAQYTTPYVYATWDDHDYGLNDAGKYWEYKEEAQRQFNDFWDVPEGDPRRERGGIYSSEIVENEFGTVQFIILDTRYFRTNLTEVPDSEFEANGGPYTPNEPGEGTMLGGAQWRWLRKQLRQSADVRIIVSSVQVLPTAQAWEGWRNFPSERQRLFNMIEHTGAGGVVFVSGDRHSGMLYSTKLGNEKTPYPFYEMTASGLSEYYPGNTEPGPMRIGAPYGAQNWGAVDIDWLGRSITLSLRNNAGEAVRSVAIDMDEIKAGGPQVEAAKGGGSNSGTGTGECVLQQCM